MKTGNLKDQFSWDTAGAIDDLKTWWAEGFSCSLIAENNAVIGKVTRLGLPTHKNLSPRHAKASPRKPRAAPKVRIDGKLPRTTGFRPMPDDGAEWINSTLDPRAIPFGQRKQLLELGPEDCRFPYGDVGKPGFFFCGGNTLGIRGCYYCSFHYRAVHQPPRKISRAEFERNRILGLRATERLRVKREASA